MRDGRRNVAGSWWNPASPSEVEQEQARVNAARAAVNAALAASPPKGDPTAIDRAVRAWNALDAEVVGYLGEGASLFWWSRDAQVMRGQSYEAQIEAWRRRFVAMGVSIAAPAAPPKTGTDIFGDLTLIAYAILGIMALQAFKK